MDGKTCAPRPITGPKVLLVEGQDEENLFGKLISELELSDIEVRRVGGTSQFRPAVRTLRQTTGHERIISLGVVRDADLSAEGAFQSIRDALREAGWPVPRLPLDFMEENPRVGVMILPVGRPCGMLEDVCLTSVAEDPAMSCVDDYLTCLATRLDQLPRNASKAMVRDFLVSREILEESHFEYLQAHLEEWAPAMPDPPSVERIHLFLASRYRPHLDLGEAAQAGYWSFENSAFDPIKEFLRNL